MCMVGLGISAGKEQHDKLVVHSYICHSFRAKNGAANPKNCRNSAHRRSLRENEHDNGKSSMNQDIFPIEKWGDFSIVMIVFAGCFLIFADIGSLQLDPLDSYPGCRAVAGSRRWNFAMQPGVSPKCPLMLRKTCRPKPEDGQHPCPHGYKNNNTYVIIFYHIGDTKIHLEMVVKFHMWVIWGGVTDTIVTYLNKAFESVAGHCDSCGGKGKGDESTGESGTSQVSPSGSWTAACFWCWKSYFSMCSRLVARVWGKQHVIECSYLHQNMMMRYNTIENKIYIYVYVLNMGD